jgi:hypothetical protein
VALCEVRGFCLNSGDANLIFLNIH